MPINSLFDSFLSYLPIVIQLFPFHQNVKQGKEGGVKGKGSAEGEPLGAGESPRFALGFVLSPAPIRLSPLRGFHRLTYITKALEGKESRTIKAQSPRHAATQKAVKFSVTAGRGTKAMLFPLQ